MPTTRRRHLITETDLIAEALNDAARRWPEDQGSRAKLLVHLVEEGHQSILARSKERAEARRAAIDRTIGALTGTYEVGYLERLREDWPE